MKKKLICLICLVLAASLTLSGCSGMTLEEYYNQLQSDIQQEHYEENYIPYDQMEYERPDMDALTRSLEKAIEASKGKDLDAIIEAIYDFYDHYDWFYTHYYLADIRYSGDLTDSYWEKEYLFCSENAGTVDASLEELYYALADSPCREELESDDYFGEGFFDAYDGENMWTEEFVAMLDREAQLQAKYHELTAQSAQYGYDYESYYDDCADEIAQVLVDLIKVRKEMAEYWGYEDYAQFAFDFYYYRDYTPEQMAQYLSQVQQELVPLYMELDGSAWNEAYRRCSEEQALDYVRQMARNMGGTIEDAFNLMENAGLYDIAPGENKYNASFEIFLPGYQEPFIFVNPAGNAYDKLTLTHEFGHFCNDYASYGSVAGIDVAEIYSQGMEYLSLFYAEDGQRLTRLKMADSLQVYVVQAAFATFEYRMYNLTGEELSVEGLYALYSEVALEFGFGAEGYDPREFVDIPHFYASPMYVISYVVSNDAAMQFYQLELSESGKGLALMEQSLDSEESYFLAFLDSAGLESPFAPGRIQQVRDTFREILG